MVGVGALVINDKNEVLVVSEKNSLIKDSWKLPGGYVEPSEFSFFQKTLLWTADKKTWLVICF